MVELLQKALGSVENPTLDQISRIARNLNLTEAQVYNFVNRNRPKKRRYSTSDIVRPNRRFDLSANPFGSSSQNSDEGSDGVIRSEGMSYSGLFPLRSLRLRDAVESHLLMHRLVHLLTLDFFF